MNRIPFKLLPFLVLTMMLLSACFATAPTPSEPPPTEQPTETPVIDQIATGVAEAQSIAATLTAGAPLPILTSTPVSSPIAVMTVSTGANYGPTEHCSAKAGFATIELRNIVPNVKSLDMIIDNVKAATVDSGRYGCIYLTDGLHYFQWKNESEQVQSNARSFTINGSDGWNSGSKRPDGIRNPYDAWLDPYKPTPTLTPKPSVTPKPTP